jgi:hypothetical protein
LTRFARSVRSDWLRASGSASPATIPASTIGLDLSDKTVTFCQLDAVGDIVERGNFQLTRAALQKRFAKLPAAAKSGEYSARSSRWRFGARR